MEKKFSITIEHEGCFTQLQRNFQDLSILDVNITRPRQLGNTGRVAIFPGYMVLRGNTKEKESFYKKCKTFQTDAIAFTLLSDPFTGFSTEPCIFYYETIEFTKPCFLSIVYSLYPELRYSWPFVLKMENGYEKILLQGREEYINEKFKTEFEQHKIGRIVEIKVLDDAQFEQAENAFEDDKKIVCGLHIFETLKKALKEQVVNHRHKKFLEEALLSPECNKKCLQDISNRHTLTYDSGRQIIAKTRKDIEKTLKNDIFRVVLSDLEDSFDITD